MDSINKQVKLGVFRSDDLESILSAHNSTELKELTLSYPFPVSLLAAKDWLNSRLEASTNFPIQINLAIRENETNNLEGYVNLSNIDWISKTAEIEIVIFNFKSFAGVGSEIFAQVRELAFKNYSLRKLYAWVIENNTNSTNFFIKNGFVLEGKLEEFKLIGEDYLGVNIFALKNAPK